MSTYSPDPSLSYCLDEETEEQRTPTPSPLSLLCMILLFSKFAYLSLLSYLFTPELRTLPVISCVHFMFRKCQLAHFSEELFQGQSPSTSW